MRRLASLVAVFIVMAGCSGAATSVEDPGQEMPAPGNPGTDGVDRGERGYFDDRPDLVIEGRRVIYSAQLQLHSDDTRKLYEEITALVEASGGFVASAQVQPTQSSEDQPAISMVLRLPATQLTETMRLVKEMSKTAVSESKSAQDVSDQFVDLEARLTNLEALETELRAMLTEVRAQADADPEKVLRVFSELASVRGQIEQIEGQIKYLADLTQLASLEVGITQSPSVAPIVREPWAPAEAMREAAGNLVAALQSIANWMISFAIYTLPVLTLTLAIPLMVGLWAYRKWWKGRAPRPRTTPGQPSEI